MGADRIGQMLQRQKSQRYGTW